MTAATDANSAPRPAAAGQDFGYHLRIEMSGCDLDRIRSGAEVLSWVQRLVSPAGIDMTAHGEPWLDHFGPEPGKIGWTVFQPITESNILGHFNDDGTGFVDVFSCRWFNPDKVLHITREFFNPQNVTHDFKARRAPERTTT